MSELNKREQLRFQLLRDYIQNLPSQLIDASVEDVIKDLATLEGYVLDPEKGEPITVASKWNVVEKHRSSGSSSLFSTLGEAVSYAVNLRIPGRDYVMLPDADLETNVHLRLQLDGTSQYIEVSDVSEVDADTEPSSA